MLTVLLHSGVGEVVAVSSRWFGGTKLSTGGLARTYAAGVTHALQALPTVRRVPRERLEVVVGYARVHALRQVATDLDVRVEDQRYGSEVRWRVAVPLDRVAEFRSLLADATAGEARIEAGVGISSERRLRGRPAKGGLRRGPGSRGARRLLEQGGARWLRERDKASVRAKVEHPFLYVKRRFGYRKVRYRGLAKNMERIALLLGFANLLVAGRYSTA